MWRIGLSIVMALHMATLAFGSDQVEESIRAAVVALLEDDTEPLLKVLTENDGRGDATRETTDVYSGAACLRVTPLQRYQPRIAGWSFPIAERPAPGQYRYLRFAWKKIGGTGIMVQLSDNGDWQRRYVAGQNTQGWVSRQVADKAPDEWTVMTFDLFKDYGPATITGIALTPLDGTAGLFDHIYLARSLDDLERIDATGLTKTPFRKELSRDELQGLWSDLAGKDASRAYRARWTLVAAASQSVPFLQEQMKPVRGVAGADRLIARLIADLDDDDFAVREHASQQLRKLGPAAVRPLKAGLDKSPSLEVRRRIEAILRETVGEGAPAAELVRSIQAVRILELTGTADARRALEALAKGAADVEITLEARAALVRMKGEQR